MLYAFEKINYNEKEAKEMTKDLTRKELEYMVYATCKAINTTNEAGRIVSHKAAEILKWLLKTPKERGEELKKDLEKELLLREIDSRFLRD